MGRQGVDMRPHIYCNINKSFILVDSGAQICAFPPDPGDEVDPNMTLKAVNGSRLKCYGTKEVFVQIGRKKYPMEVIKTDVKHPILGWNFVRRHKKKESCYIFSNNKLRYIETSKISAAN